MDASGPRTLLHGRSPKPRTGYAGYPSVCSGCGKRVTLTGGEPLWFETTRGEARSWHFACRPPPPGRAA